VPDGGVALLGCVWDTALCCTPGSSRLLGAVCRVPPGRSRTAYHRG
jgi:hypothetical protein